MSTKSIKTKIKSLLGRLIPNKHKHDENMWNKTRIMRFATMEDANEYARTHGCDIVFFQRQQAKAIHFHGGYVNVHDIWAVLKRNGKPILKEKKEEKDKKQTK